jgi:hypothetical protein
MQLLLHRNIDSTNRIVAVTSILLGIFGTYNSLGTMYDYKFGSTVYFLMLPVSALVCSFLLSSLLTASGISLLFRKTFCLKLFFIYCFSSLMVLIINFIFNSYEVYSLITFLPHLLIGIIFFLYFSGKRIKNHFGYIHTFNLWSTIFLISTAYSLIPYLLFMKSYLR